MLQVLTAGPNAGTNRPLLWAGTAYPFQRTKRLLLFRTDRRFQVFHFQFPQRTNRFLLFRTDRRFQVFHFQFPQRTNRFLLFRTDRRFQVFHFQFPQRTKRLLLFWTDRRFQVFHCTFSCCCLKYQHSRQSSFTALIIGLLQDRHRNLTHQSEGSSVQVWTDTTFLKITHFVWDIHFCDPSETRKSICT